MVFQKKTGVLFLIFIFRFFFSPFTICLLFYIFLYHDINGGHIHTVMQAREGKGGRVLGRVRSSHLVILLIFFFLCHFFQLFILGINFCCNFYS
ncbi:hypothetical protein DFP73DRAFT_153350 [Morchella snyderi]|nr:hypothetical protein DFP73DRAFT_153350 [Morchella snyderi]